jgi:hypothetical protein
VASESARNKHAPSFGINLRTSPRLSKIFCGLRGSFVKTKKKKKKKKKKRHAFQQHQQHQLTLSINESSSVASRTAAVVGSSSARGTAKAGGGDKLISVPNKSEI